MNLQHRDIPAKAGPLASTKGENMMIHMFDLLSVLYKPAVRVEVLRIGAEDPPVALDDPRVYADDCSGWEER